MATRHSHMKHCAKIRRPRFFSRRKIVEVAGLKKDAALEKNSERGGEISPVERLGGRTASVPPTFLNMFFQFFCELGDVPGRHHPADFGSHFL